DRIAVTGISGGGAATFWIAAADDRVKCAVPGSGMSDLESYVKNKVINGHCDCMFLYNTFGWEWTTIAALVAPRPLLFANSDKDGPKDAINGKIDETFVPLARSQLPEPGKFDEWRSNKLQKLRIYSFRNLLEPTVVGNDSIAFPELRRSEGESLSLDLRTDKG